MQQSPVSGVPDASGIALKEIPLQAYTKQATTTEHTEKISGKNYYDNRIIHGDNLLALAALQGEFEGRIKCIYIDPPYNTGGKFTHYHDDLAHARWVGFMRERLVPMRELLSEDGVLFVSIGDDECAYLKVLLDEIFGRANFCGTLIWKKKKKPSFLDRNMGGVTEFILAYARNRAKTGAFIGGRTTPGKRTPINNAGNTLSVLKFPAGTVRFGCPDGLFDPQDMSEGRIITRLLDAVEIRNGRNVTAFRLEGEWRYSQSTLDAIIRAGETITISRMPFRPNHIKPGGAPKKLCNLLDGEQVGAYEDATAESRALFGADKAFDYPKPERLIETLISAVTQPGDWVLDAFAGSGTTGAVAHKTGRQWILIEQGDHCRTHLQHRLRKIIDGTDPGGITQSAQWQGGGGFKFFHVS